MNNISKGLAQINPLIELQKNFCLLFLGNQNRVGLLNEINLMKNGLRIDDINMYKIEDGKLHMRRFLENLPVETFPKIIIDNFMVNPKTKEFNQIAFTPLKTPKKTINYWIKPNIKPIKGSCFLIYNFLENVICNGDNNLFSYLLDYLAHMIQKPEEKPGVMIVMLGGQGTGKGTFFYLLRKIWPRTTLQVSDIDHIVGGFNASLERNFIVCMDEALFSGQKKSMDRMKAFVTEEYITIEQKYQPKRNLHSIHRFFATTNHEHFGNVELDDRRLVFLNISNEHQGNHKYFYSLYDSINDSKQIEALYYDLYSRDISKFNVRAKPKSKELLNQKLKSLNGFDRFWYEVLTLGYFDVGRTEGSFHVWKEPEFVASTSLSSFYQDYQKGKRQYSTIQFTEISSGINKWCPSANSIRKNTNSIAQRGYQFPCLDDARVSFENKIGESIPWP